MVLKKINILSIIIISLIFLLDRFSKIEIINKFNNNPVYVNDFLNIDLVWNTGIGFGLFSTSSTIFYNLITILIGIIILFLMFLALKAKDAENLIFSVIIGGALGNFYDRLFFNAVPDFIDLHFKSFHWFTFNVSDIFITLGIIAFIMGSKFEKN